MRKRKLKPIGINRLNKIMEDFNSDYHIEKKDGELVMVKNEQKEEWKEEVREWVKFMRV